MKYSALTAVKDVHICVIIVCRRQSPVGSQCHFSRNSVDPSACRKLRRIKFGIELGAKLICAVRYKVVPWSIAGRDRSGGIHLFCFGLRGGGRN